MNLLKKFAIRMMVAVGVCGLGIALNVATVIANHGFMPVFVPGCPENVALDSRHVCAGSHSQLMPFIDLFYFHGWIYSLGDFFILAGQVFGLLSVLFMAVSCITSYFSRRRSHGG